jgi:hypothetical protein
MVHCARLCEQNLVGAVLKRDAGVAPGPRCVQQIGDLSRGLVIGDALRSYIRNAIPVGVRNSALGRPVT